MVISIIIGALNQLYRFSSLRDEDVGEGDAEEYKTERDVQGDTGLAVFGFLGVGLGFVDLEFELWGDVGWDGV